MRKRMTKSQSNRMLTGTIGGIAEYFGIDPTIARVIFVFISVILVGAPVFLYILLALIIPRAHSSRGNNYQQYHYERPKQSKKQRKRAEAVEEDNWSDF
jgi:phage shock protein PspC (stress-responsive transcriptional regulator)